MGSEGRELRRSKAMEGLEGQEDVCAAGWLACSVIALVILNDTLWWDGASVSSTELLRA